MIPTRYLPCLIDRLENGGQSVDITVFRSRVGEDISRLLKQPRSLFPLRPTGAPEDNREEISAAQFPLVAESVLNYGLDLPFGTAVSPQVLEQIRVGILRSIELFEPRAANVKVALWDRAELSADRFLTPTEQKNMTGRPVFIIEADIVVGSFVEQIIFKTEFDMISGECYML